MKKVIALIAITLAPFATLPLYATTSSHSAELWTNWQFSLDLNAQANLLKSNETTDGETVGISAIPELRVAKYFTDNYDWGIGLGIGYSGLSSFQANTSSITPTSRAALNGNDNFAAIEFILPTPFSSTQANNSTAINNMEIGVGYANLEVIPSSGKFDNGLFGFFAFTTNLFALKISPSTAAQAKTVESLKAKIENIYSTDGEIETKVRSLPGNQSIQ